MESLTHSTKVEQPHFLYDYDLDESRVSLHGSGIMMMGVDILPSELPREVSTHFGPTPNLDPSPDATSNPIPNPTSTGDFDSLWP